jgi:hypothetical protein
MKINIEYYEAYFNDEGKIDLDLIEIKRQIEITHSLKVEIIRKEGGLGGLNDLVIKFLDFAQDEFYDFLLKGSVTFILSYISKLDKSKRFSDEIYSVQFILEDTTIELFINQNSIRFYSDFLNKIKETIVSLRVKSGLRIERIIIPVFSKALLPAEKQIDSLADYLPSCIFHYFQFDENSYNRTWGLKIHYEDKLLSVPFDVSSKQILWNRTFDF